MFTIASKHLSAVTVVYTETNMAVLRLSRLVSMWEWNWNGNTNTHIRHGVYGIQVLFYTEAGAR